MSEPGADASANPEVLASPEEFVQAARLAPDHRLHLADPAWQGDGQPPTWAVVGQWRSDAEGQIVEWEDDEDYRPSPEAMGWPEPTDDVDRAVQLATTGYGPADDVTAALAGAEVAVLVTADGEPVSAAAPGGTAVVPVYTSSRHLQAVGQVGFELLPVADLLGRIPQGHALCLNSSAPVSMVVATDGLADVLREAAEAETAEPTADPAREPQVGTAGTLRTTTAPEAHRPEPLACALGARPKLFGTITSPIRGISLTKVQMTLLVMTTPQTLHAVYLHV
ncbi:type VII secretion system-associated protein [Streptomyces sp. For3]|nr:type VII secretion system-associated protein [Streptomyces silvae]